MSDSFADRFESYWDDRPVTSLRRIQTLYGAIAEARTDDDSVVPQEFQLYVTPDELQEFTTTEGGGDGPKLVTVFVDLTDEPTIDDVGVSTARPEDVPKLGFSRYPWGRGIDNSITRRGAKGGSTVSTATTYCVECLNRWTDGDGREPAVGRVASEHPDGWVIEGLQTLGQREDLEDDLREELEREYDGGSRVTATVAIRIDPDRLEYEPTGVGSDGYYYPGHLHVLNSAMKARKEEKLARKNIDDSDPPSRGEAACLVTGEVEEVFGTAEDPLAFFTIQHAEKFYGLKKPEAWRAHSISAEAALLVQSGQSLVEGFRTTRRGRGVYTIPYFTRMDAERARELASVVEGTDLDSQADIAEIQDTFERMAPDLAADLRFYIVVVRNDSGDINVLGEAPNVSIQPARELSKSHFDVLDGSTFDVTAGFERPSDWMPIADDVTENQVVRSIVGGFYAYGTLSIPDEDAPAADDPADWLTFSILGDEPIPVERLLEEYVERFTAEQRGDDENRLPENHLKAQYAQLEALARAKRLEATSRDSLGSDYTQLTQMPSLTTDLGAAVDALVDADGTLAARWKCRAFRLDEFIENRPAFENDDRRGAFLAGVFVGQLGRYQADKREMNQTILQQYPAEQMTGARIDRFLPGLVDKMNAYAVDDPYSGPSLFPELEDRITELSGLEWGLDTNDLRFHYAIGQLYGKRADYRAYQLQQAVADEAGIDTENTDS